MKDEKHLLFKEEALYLKEAKQTLKQAEGDSTGLIYSYKELIDHYERLLKITSKVFKISDIQSKALIERELQLQDAHRNLEKMEDSRRQLISDISHEIGTPMTSIQGYLKAMLDQVIEPDENYIRLIYQKALLVNQLIEDLYDLSHIEYSQNKLKFQYVCIKDLDKLLLSKYKIDVESKELNYEFTSSIPQDIKLRNVYIDPIRIEQILTNLIHNAVKFTPKGGNIKLDVSIQIKKDREKQELIIHVSDTGIGISEDALPRIFDRFYKTKGSLNKDGTGLGLAISKEIVVKHQGEIGVESLVGKGSTFYFTLPIHD
ncbi:cell wall metabolism sensor histidine kinase WalK [Ammoniphilus sp. CFH 90114]|uniref:sensor histidine kinase n=1 Tax=Ammoniphilus sp. CFH 90114 TaxID=2493665 RepID=UPI00100F4E66|nr:HAMP domain-containing sensor histidine kinase [Ammoniphilus sp. CFH 90114]RXT06486.1 HAMP domain-containing histidine kinase [Ammoniphilus sp. CFH 90114]